MEEYSKYLAICFAGRENCTPGHSFGPAIRPHYLMHVVLEGKGYYQVNHMTYFLQRGEAFLIRPNEITFYKADEEEPWSYAWVAFDGYEAKNILRKTQFLTENVVARPKDADLFIEQIKILSDLFVKQERNEFQLVGQFYYLMGQLELSGKEGEDQENQKQQYFQKALDYILHNYSYPLKISDIARHVGVDRTYLYKIFMEVEQCSPKQFLSEFRLKAAMNMLGTMKYSVTEAAYSCGFKETAAFCSYFKNKMGVTPSDYRKELQRNRFQTEDIVK